MLIATHDLELAARLCTRVLVLEEGRLVDEGAGVEGVLRRWGGRPESGAGHAPRGVGPEAAVPPDE